MGFAAWPLIFAVPPPGSKRKRQHTKDQPGQPHSRDPTPNDVLAPPGGSPIHPWCPAGTLGLDSAAPSRPGCWRTDVPNLHTEDGQVGLLNPRKGHKHAGMLLGSVEPK
jgi:hypothetical protein